MNLRQKYYFAALSFYLISSPIVAATAPLNAKIRGIEDPILKNVSDRFAVIEKEYGANPSYANVQEFYKNGPRNIVQAIKPYGYFKAHITKSWLTRKGDSWTANYVISLGPAVKIIKIDAKVSGPGAQNPAFQKTLAEMPIQSGQILVTQDYDKTKDSFFTTANSQGYLKGYFTEQQIQVNLEKNTAVIILHFNTRQRFYFGKLRINQSKDIFANNFLERYANFKEGQPFSSQKLVDLQQSLSNTSYFSEVGVTPDLENSTNYTVPVDLNLKPSKGQQYNAGIGYGTFTGTRLTVDAKFRHLNAYGHQANLQLKLSKVLSGVGAQYIIPGGNPLTDQYTIGGNAQKFTPKNGHSLSETIYLGYLKTMGNWKANTNLSYLKEHSNIVSKPAINSHVLYPNLEITHLKADDMLYTHYGHKVDFLVRGSSTKLFSSITFSQAELKGKYIFSPTDVSRVILRGDIGYTVVDNYNKLPLSLQFYAGGLDSIRGFTLTYFGPAKYIKIASAEYQHHIYGNFNGAVFLDVGVADNHFNAPVSKGVGLGLIYTTPVGPVKMYYGFGFEKNKSRHSDIEFSIGPDL